MPICCNFKCSRKAVINIANNSNEWHYCLQHAKQRVRNSADGKAEYFFYVFAYHYASPVARAFGRKFARC